MKKSYRKRGRSNARTVPRMKKRGRKVPRRSFQGGGKF